MIQPDPDMLEKEFSIDTGREYITGHSMGGGGTWTAVKTQPRRFAAAVIASPGIRDAPDDMAEWAQRLAHIPCRLFHGNE